MSSILLFSKILMRYICFNQVKQMLHEKNFKTQQRAVPENSFLTYQDQHHNSLKCLSEYLVCLQMSPCFILFLKNIIKIEKADNKFLVELCKLKKFIGLF